MRRRSPAALGVDDEDLYVDIHLLQNSLREGLNTLMGFHSLGPSADVHHSQGDRRPEESHERQTSPEEPPCHDKTRPKQNQGRGLRLNVRLNSNVIDCAVGPCDGLDFLRAPVLHELASANSGGTGWQTTGLAVRLKDQKGGRRENSGRGIEAITDARSGQGDRRNNIWYRGT
jgi:hypothetical protein